MYILFTVTVSSVNKCGNKQLLHVVDRCVTLEPNEVHSAFITRKNILTCQEHLERKLLLLTARFILK